MAFSLQNERAKVQFILSITFILLFSIETASPINLIDSPLILPGGSAEIHAILTDLNESKRYFIQEFISASGSTFKGKIIISGEKDSYNIHYNTAPGFNKERLVIHGTNCLPFTFKNNWDKTLPGIKTPVTNLILLMGPSILYRLEHSMLVWKSADNKNIRGTVMKGVTSEINKRLKITTYFNKHSADYGIRYPIRIEFSGYDPSSTLYINKENLILDIYMQEESYSNIFIYEVQPLPGVGCTHYLNSQVVPFPTLKAKYVHFIMCEYMHKSTNIHTLKEIQSSETSSLLRIKTTLFGKTKKAIYDYQLGITYIFLEGGSCVQLSGDLNSPGIDSFGYYNFRHLLLVDENLSNFQYLGKLKLKHRSELPVEAWETIRYNININGEKVDKAVITQYFIKSRNSKIFSGHTLVGTSIAFHKLDPLKKTYTLTDGITRDYMSFKEADPEYEPHDIFSLKDCKYVYNDRKLTFSFKFACQDKSSSCIKLTERRVCEFKKNFIRFFIIAKKISALRIDSVQYNVNADQIEMDVTFLEAPNIRSIFYSINMVLSEDTIKKMKKIEATSESECLEKLSEFQDSISAIIYERIDETCGYLINYDDLKGDTEFEDTEQFYHVYRIPLHNFHRVRKELLLDQIHNAFLQDIGKSYYLLPEDNLKPYKFIDIVNKTEPRDTWDTVTRFVLKKKQKLVSKRQDTVTVPDAKSFVDCYRTCHKSEQFQCQQFSFCENGDLVDCTISNISTLSDAANREHNNSCSIYSLYFTDDYQEVHQRKFKKQTSKAVETYFFGCAELCRNSPDCFSFQFCGDFCSFGGVYTDVDTEYDKECSVFYPKVLQKYQKTGNKIVSEVIRTEINLDLEQCASLCHGWSDGDIKCKSFNYCPNSRKKSSCSLTKFSVESSNVATVEGGDCSNYELKANRKKNKRSSSIEAAKGIKASGAFGIIMMFLISGTLLGFAAPIAYTKTKHMRQKPTKVWTRHMNTSKQVESIH